MPAERNADAFRAEARTWLAANAPAFERRSGAGPAEGGEHGDIDAVRAWQARKAEGRFVGMTLPAEFGGRGATGLEVAIFADEEAAYDLPRNPVLPTQHDILMPAIAECASPEFAHAVLPAMLRGDELWCQLFSEPGAGSDIAAVGTRAVRDDDGWIVNGQKTWNSVARIATWGFLIARTDPDVPKHKGLSCFRVPMDAPGVAIRPIREMTGDSFFSDVFFDDVRLANDAIIGAPGDGWKIVMSCLRHERQALASMSSFEDDPFGRVFALACAPGPDGHRPIDRRDARARLAQSYVRGQGARNLRDAALAGLATGGTPGPEASVGKLVLGARNADLLAYAIELAGEGGIVADPEVSPDLAWLHHQQLWTYGLRVGGGTEDILRNVVAESVLGLPPDPRVDKDVSFAELQARARRT